MPANDDRATPATDARGEQAGQRRRRRRITGLATLTGLAAVTATAGLVTGVLIARPGSAPSARAAQAPARSAAAARTGPGSLPGNKLDEVTVPAPSAAVADVGLPRYFALASQGDPNGLEIRSSATGKLVSMIASPGDCMPATYQVTVAGDDRNFVFSCLTTATRENSYYRLRISSQGVSTAVTQLPVAPIASTFVTGLALTPDGRKLAIGLKSSISGTATIQLVTLATGAIRTWTGHLDRPTMLTWADNGRELGFWAWGLRELNVTAAGSNLASARLILSIFHKTELVQNALLSPDGTTVIADVSYDQPKGSRTTPSTVIGGIAQVLAGTGKTTRLFVAQHVQGNAVYPCQLGAIDVSGHHLLAGCTRFERVDRGRATALAGPDIQAAFTGAW